MAVQEKLLTAEEFAALPNNDGIFHELVNGVVIEMPPASTLHSFLDIEIATLLRMYVGERMVAEHVSGEQGGYLLSCNPDTVRAPDVGFITAARAGEYLNKTYIEGAPDLAVEVISPDDSAAEMQAKPLEYLAAGARLVWLVYPKTQTVVVHTPEGARTYTRNETLNGGDVLPGLQIPVAAIFSVLPEGTTL